MTASRRRPVIRAEADKSFIHSFLRLPAETLQRTREKNDQAVASVARLAAKSGICRGLTGLDVADH